MNADLFDVGSAAAAEPHERSSKSREASQEPHTSTPSGDAQAMLSDEARTLRHHDAHMLQYARSGDANAQGQPDLRTLFGKAVDAADTTPRSEVPVASDAVNEDLLARLHGLESDSNYFSPQPLRPRSSISHTAEPSPAMGTAPPRSSTVDPSDGSSQRPGYSRDYSDASTATLRPNSADSFDRDGPHYPSNTNYAALHHQYHSRSHGGSLARSRKSRTAHEAGLSVSNIAAYSINGELHRSTMDTAGSRTAGNTPASSPGLFGSAGPPMRQESDDSLTYSTPWLHPAHRQPPKETHVADRDVDPVSGRKMINNYEICDELGRGVHGKVKLARNLETGNAVAIKIVERFSKRPKRLGKNTSHQDKIKREIAILKKVRHPNIVSLIEVIDDPSIKKVYIILEHVTKGEVKWRIEGAREVCLVEWRRYQRESHGIFESEGAELEDEKIIRMAHQKLIRHQRRAARERRQRQQLLENGGEPGHESWSLELGGESDDDDYFELSSSLHDGDRTPNRYDYSEHRSGTAHGGTNMETAFRSHTPVSREKTSQARLAEGLEGTMYGAYTPPEGPQGRTPSIPGSMSSMFTDEDDNPPEHFEHVPVMTMQQTREVFRDTVLGLEYLHYQNVIHRDIKPANLLRTADDRIKISDFGVSYLGRPSSPELNGDQSESEAHDPEDAIELAKTVGTPAFYAPELCQTDLDADPPHVGRGIDIWALGVTLHCLVYGRVPFHDHNQWALMKRIAEEEPYISRYRLKPVEDGSQTRPPSHGRMYHSMTSTRRAAHDLEYEEIDNDLQDLFRRLFVKNSRHRITIQEIKRHPWLTSGIENPSVWMEETDPDRSAQGGRIQISKEDIEKAVQPISLLEHLKFGLRKVVEGAKGLTRQGSSRKRAQSTTGEKDVPRSANSSSSTISQEGRRPSLGPGLSTFYEALSKSREPEHPLSQSVTASPAASDRMRYFDNSSPRTGSPALSADSKDYLGPLSAGSRPRMTDRAQSSISSATSIRTVRPSDLRARDAYPSSDLPMAMPGMPTPIDTPGGIDLAGIFSGSPKRVHGTRSDEKMLRPPEHMRARSIDRLVNPAEDAHAEPSVALSPTIASGVVDQADLLLDRTPSRQGFGSSLAEMHYPHNIERAASRQSSMSSVSSRLQSSWTARSREMDVGSSLDMAPATGPIPVAREVSEENFSRAKDEFIKRRIVEDRQNRERPRSGTQQRPPSALSQSACPPSPDDEPFAPRRKVEDFLNQQQPSSETSPVSYLPTASSQQMRVLTSSSSEDHFTSMSQSTSNPSIPSVVSANSSYAPDDCSRAGSYPQMTHADSEESMYMNQFDAPTEDPAGYDGDHPVESDDDDSDEDGLFIGKKRAVKAPVARRESVSNAELARSSVKEEIAGLRQRSARSNSNGTVKKIPPPEGPAPAEAH